MQQEARSEPGSFGGQQPGAQPQHEQRRTGEKEREPRPKNNFSHVLSVNVIFEKCGSEEVFKLGIILRGNGQSETFWMEKDS